MYRTIGLTLRLWWTSGFPVSSTTLITSTSSVDVHRVERYVIAIYGFYKIYIAKWPSLVHNTHLIYDLRQTQKYPPKYIYYCECVRVWSLSNTWHYTPWTFSTGICRRLTFVLLRQQRKPSRSRTNKESNLNTATMKYLTSGHRESYTLVARKRYMKRLVYVYSHIFFHQNFHYRHHHHHHLRHYFLCKCVCVVF